MYNESLENVSILRTRSYLSTIVMLLTMMRRRMRMIKITTIQGGRGWLAFVERSRIPQTFRRTRICELLRHKCRFLLLRESKQAVVIKGLKHTKTSFLKHPFRCLDMYFFLQSFNFTKALWKLYESSLKAGSPDALPKQDDFRKKLYESLSKSM